MSKTQKQTRDSTEASLTTEQVADYLRDHSGFFLEQPDLLDVLAFPHETGSATSLLVHQAKRLREQNQKLQSKLTELVSIARENERLSRHFNRLAVELMQVSQLHELLSMTQHYIQEHLDTDYVCFKFLPHLQDRLPQPGQHAIDDGADCYQQLCDWISQRDPVCGSVPTEVSQQLFGQSLDLGSCALIPLYHTEELGLLCLGSPEKQRFRVEMGTLFLKQIGELISMRIAALQNK